MMEEVARVSESKGEKAILNFCTRDFVEFHE